MDAYFPERTEVDWLAVIIKHNPSVAAKDTGRLMGATSCIEAGGYLFTGRN